MNPAKNLSSFLSKMNEIEWPSLVIEFKLTLTVDR